MTFAPDPTGLARSARGRRRHRRGFTLLETALALVIVSVGVVAIVEAHQSFIIANRWSSHESTATYLANELRERMRTLPRHDPITGLRIVSGPTGGVVEGWGRESTELLVTDFDDIDDYDGLRFGQLAGVPGTTFTGPIDAFGRVIPEIDVNGQIVTQSGVVVPLRGWAQSVEVVKVDPFDMANSVPLSQTVQANGVPREIDRWPLKVTVSVWFQDHNQAAAERVVSVSWIVPATR